MDPTANLAEQLTLAAAIQARAEGDNSDVTMEGMAELLALQAEDAARLAELVLALDEWIRKGGFLPAPWKGATIRTGQAGGGAQ